MPTNSYEDQVRQLEVVVRKLKKRLKIWMILFFYLLFLSIACFYFIGTKREIVKPASLKFEKASALVQYGKCKDSTSDTNYIRVEVNLTGENLNLRSFEWNNLEYASGNSCFKNNQGQIVHSMVNFIPYQKKDSISSFDAIIRTTSTDNPYTFGVKVFNTANKLIGKFPDSTDVLKDTIPSLRDPAIILQKVKIKK